MTDRPEYVRCVRRNSLETWCDRQAPEGSHEFFFVDPTHAINNAYVGGRLLICPECANEMTRAISAGRWTPP